MSKTVDIKKIMAHLTKANGYVGETQVFIQQNVLYAISPLCLLATYFCTLKS
jgi:hypothetical protein